MSKITLQEEKEVELTEREEKIYDQGYSDAIWFSIKCTIAVGIILYLITAIAKAS